MEDMLRQTPQQELVSHREEYKQGGPAACPLSPRAFLIVSQLKVHRCVGHPPLQLGQTSQDELNGNKTCLHVLVLPKLVAVLFDVFAT